MNEKPNYMTLYTKWTSPSTEVTSERLNWSGVHIITY